MALPTSDVARRAAEPAGMEAEAMEAEVEAAATEEAETATEEEEAATEEEEAATEEEEEAAQRGSLMAVRVVRVEISTSGFGVSTSHAWREIAGGGVVGEAASATPGSRASSSATGHSLYAVASRLVRRAHGECCLGTRVHGRRAEPEEGGAIGDRLAS